MKKIELHIHLDGSLKIEYVEKLLNRPVKNEMIANKCQCLTEYLDKFKLPISLLQSKENIENFSYLLGESLIKDDVIYAEIRFCPLFHTSIINKDEVIKSVISGLHKTPLKFNLILCMMRNFSEDKNIEIIELADKYLNKGVCGIDLAGDEKKYKTANFKNLFQLISNKHIPFTIHAGEADDYTSINDAISFNTKRIGHGIRAIENYDTIKKLIKNNITLEICPTSNIDTNIYSSIKDHPIKKLIDLGVKVTINTDNRTVSNITLEKEYQKLKNELNFTDNDLLKCNLNAIEASFLTDNEKEELKKRIMN